MKHYTWHKGEKLAIAEHIRLKGHVKTSELISWASENRYTNRADRNARDLATEGFIRRLSPAEEKAMYGDIGERVWKWESDYSNYQPCMKNLLIKEIFIGTQKQLSFI